jgi:hypothetical protein
MKTYACLLPLIAIAAIVLFAPPAHAAAKGNAKNPDLTKGEPIPEGYDKDWTLGATGARGWMYPERLTTTTARQIAVTKVEPGSPADGVLQVGDVILGVFGKPFDANARFEFGEALTRAESDAGKGGMVLTRWRDGKAEEVVLQLPVLGTYSATAPYNCPKSKRILEQGCEALAQSMLDEKYRPNPIVRSFNALGLLASGERKYWPLIKREAELTADSKPGGYVSWWYGPMLIFLSEYVIETGDTSVMPGLERLALECANGQSIVGSWGHRFAQPNGILQGYGMMNAPGVPMTIGLALAREAGVDAPEVAEAIEKSARLIRFYVGKGSIPYGDHAPWTQTHDDNGKNGMAAVLFNILGEKEAAEYFSRMSVATHGNARDTGHTGNFFNMQWAMPGVNPSGPNATGAWMKAFGSAHFDMARQHDGTFMHQGPPEPRYDKYKFWDTTGVNMVAYAMPLKQLRITGKGKPVVPQLSMKEARSLIEDGRGWNNLDRNSYYDAMTEGQLLERLTSWSPIVRERAAMALGRKKADVLPQLIKMLKSDDLYTQYGACHAFQFLRGDHAAAVPVLLETFESEDLWLRILVADALAGIGAPAREAIPVLLTRLAEADKYTDTDPRKMEQRYLAFALFDRRGLLGRSIEGVDRDLLREAVRAGLVNQDGRARSAFTSVYDKLSPEEIRPLLPAIRDAVVESSPSGIMFNKGVRTEGVKILAKHKVEQGMSAGVEYLAQIFDAHGGAAQVPKILKYLESYGTHAQAIIPQLEQITEQMEANDAKRRERARRHDGKLVRETIEKIKASKDTPKLIQMDVPRVGDAATR